MSISRRVLLRSLSASIALPVLNSCLGKKKSMVQGASVSETVSSGEIPNRLVFTESSLGVWPKTWFPDTPGLNFELKESLAPLERHKGELSVFSGMHNAGYKSNVHEAMEGFLNCTYTASVPGKSNHHSITVDQLAAEHLGQGTRFPSLVLGSYEKPIFGSSSRSLSKNKDGVPIPARTSPVEVFAALFGKTGSFREMELLFAERRSVIDATLDQLKEVRQITGKMDQERIDEYLTSLRAVEEELQREMKWSKTAKPKSPMEAIESEPEPTVEAKRHMKQMFQLMAAAMQTDSSRVFTFHLPTLHVIQEIAMSGGRHGVGHAASKGNKKSQEWETGSFKIAAEEMATFFDTLKGKKEVDGSSLFDHCLVMSGSALEEGGRHRTKNLPVLLAGNAGGKIKHGGYMPQEMDSPLSNLYLTMIQAAGVKVDSFVDSKGGIKALWA